LERSLGPLPWLPGPPPPPLSPLTPSLVI
jgi:hypothetical protein